MSPVSPPMPVRAGARPVLPRGMRPLGSAFAIVVLLALSVSPALGHAELVSSDPADGALVDTPPATVTLTFSDGLNQSRSNFELLDAGGSQLGTGRAAEDGDTVMTLAGLSLAAGQYTIKWVSVAEDGDVLRGELTFAVAEATPAPTTASSTAPPAAPSVSPPAGQSVSPPAGQSVSPPAGQSPAATPTDAVATSADPGGVVLPILVALVIVAGIGLWVVRRNRTAG